MSADQLKQFQLRHYEQRYQEEKAKGNTAAAAWLRNELFNLKKITE